jgi:hypothetical protein
MDQADPLSTPAAGLFNTTEGARLSGPDADAWRRWGPYTADRQWGTVREDYSADADPWAYFPHDHARSRAYRWGEDALAGFSDNRQLWCLGLALWNGNDPILKERLFGLANEEGNHGEDVKELYFYTDGTPTHSYMKMLYKYPQAAFPYAALLTENARRDREMPEYELLDTGVFSETRFFDVTVEYAKAGPDDILCRITVTNRAAVAAPLHVLPTFWARNNWTWSGAEKPALRLYGHNNVQALHPELPPMHLAIDQPAPWLFCENETNTNRLYGTQAPGPFKDGINDFLLHGDATAIRDDTGTKCAAHAALNLAPGETKIIRVRLRPAAGTLPEFEDFDAIVAARLAEADAFYAVVQAETPNADARLVQRQAFAGLLWSKQFYYYDVKTWLHGDPCGPTPPASRLSGRNADWQHMCAADVISMPDKWEYPWFASWDWGFHAVSFALIDPQFAKDQSLLLLDDRYMHPSGQIPAYEWTFDDANPPVQSWSALRIFQMDAAATGRPDFIFLRRCFHKLLLNFGWWVNRKDSQGKNIFQGGFLGLDNIGIFNRSAPFPAGGQLDQADGTAWMASFALYMMRIALELAAEDSVYEDMGTKFFEHFLYIAEAMSTAGNGTGLWDDQDSFFYDMLRLPDGSENPLRIRSIVGLIPMLAVQVLEPEMLAKLPAFRARLDWFLKQRPELAALISHWDEPGVGERRLLSLLRGHRLKCLLARMLDEAEFWSGQGIRALSRVHLDAPFVFSFGGQTSTVHYAPAESESGAFGGNSNWRGPVWMPLNLRLVEALREFAHYYGDDFVVEFPRRSGKMCSLRDIAAALATDLLGLTTLDAHGRRKVMAAYPQLEADILAQDLMLFHEYYDGDNGRGVGASHQTGWSAAIALLM